MTTSKKSALITTVRNVAPLVVLVRPEHAQSYNAARDFSTASIPRRVELRLVTNLASAFNPDSSSTNTYVGTSAIAWLGNRTPAMASDCH